MLNKESTHFQHIAVVNAVAVEFVVVLEIQQCFVMWNLCFHYFGMNARNNCWGIHYSHCNDWEGMHYCHCKD